jgi:RNA polymerase sigma factor (sigma-70 family)
MTYGPLSEILRHIRRIALTAESVNMDDGRLLERFIAHRDETAFEALLRRHGPMVLGICRRLLRDPHDIEDAFQATFLVLLRKASTLSKRELVANWLYGVAYRTALKTRTQAARWSAHARPLTDVYEEHPEQEVESKELRRVLDEEVRRLPSKYRVPVVLCYLEGKTYEEAAQQLGWPAGTVSTRLARARQILRTRLTRRGLEPHDGLLTTALAPTALPVQLKIATVRAAVTLTAKGAGAASLIPASVVTLMEGVLHAMFLTKLKVVATLLLMVTVIGGGAGVVTYQQLAAQSSNQQEGKPAKAVVPAQPQDVDPTQPQIDEAIKKEAERIGELATAVMTPEDKLKAMLDAADVGEKLKPLFKGRLDAAKTEVNARWKEYCAGRGTLDIYLNSSGRLLKAERDLSTKKADQVAAWETHRQRMQDAYVINQARYNEGRISIIDFAQADYYRLDAEIGLERAKAPGK